LILLAHFLLASSPLLTIGNPHFIALLEIFRSSPLPLFSLFLHTIHTIFTLSPLHAHQVNVVADALYEYHASGLVGLLRRIVAFAQYPISTFLRGVGGIEYPHSSLRAIMVNIENVDVDVVVVKVLVAGAAFLDSCRIIVKQCEL